MTSFYFKNDNLSVNFKISVNFNSQKTNINKINTNIFAKKTQQQFDNNLSQSVEYAFFHELGHLFLIEKNKDKVDNIKSSLSSKLKLNIEEGFAIHMMCLKYPGLEKTTQNFNYFQLDSDRRCNKTSKVNNDGFINKKILGIRIAMQINNPSNKNHLTL